MTSLALTVPVGIFVLLLLYLVFYRFTPLNAKQAGLVISLLSLAIYFPMVLIEWPGADVLALNVTVYFMTAYILGMFFSHRERVRMLRDEDVRLKWFHWGPAIIVGFFVTILVVDSVFVTLSREGLPDALQSLFMSSEDDGPVDTGFPGLMFNHYQKKEAQYNRYLRQQERMRELGWTVRKGWLGLTPDAGERGIFQIMVVDDKGQNIKDLSIEGRFMRAADERKDIKFTMTQQSAGVYQAALNVTEPGLWHVNIRMRSGDESFELFASTSVNE